MAVVWNTETAVGEGTGSVIVLAYGETWAPNTSIESPNGDYLLEFRTDGNLVLTQTSDDTVLWESDTADLGADVLAMQTDGNLVIYDGSTALWASGTLVFGSYLQLQDDGNLVIYSYGGIESIGVFTIPPDWSGGMLEKLEWMTSVTESPLAVEQRMGLRLSPRKSVEMSHTLFGPRRTFFDVFITAGGGSSIYLPLFYDLNKIDNAIAIGDTVINVDTTYSELRDCRRAVLIADNAFDYEVVEVWSYSDTSLTLVDGVALDWPAGTKIYPVKKVKVETQPSGERHADKAYRSKTRFLSLEVNHTGATATFGEYLDQLVLEEEPNEREALTFLYDRKIFDIDLKVGLQHISDVAPFNNESYAWFARRRQSAWRLRGLFYTLEGRRRPLWIPSYFSDFELTQDTDSTATVLTVKRCGYSDVGGPIANRDHILIHMKDGTRLYRQITGAAIVGAEGIEEVLSINNAPGIDLTPDNILRISFLYFCRLDQDSVEFTHHTDTKGLTTANSVFRVDPGIDGVGPSWADIEIDPLAPPPILPIPHPVYDPFKLPDGKLWMYAPGFGTFAGSPYIRMWWTARRSVSELLADNPNLSSGLDIPFPSYNISGDGGTIILPDTGSFTVRAGLYFHSEFGSPATIYLKIVLENANYTPSEITVNGGVADVGPRAETRTETRKSILYTKIDPDLPVKASIWFRFTGSGNLYPICNPAGDCSPYHGTAGGGGGDSYFIIEWWRT